MKRGILLLLISLLFALSSGCATKEYVKQQIDEAMKTANDRCAKAESAAERAQAAAEKAQSAAKQSMKAFDLHQKK
jgi:heme O synthase-like polyprenyltransferase